MVPLPNRWPGLPFAPSLARGVLQTAFTTPGRPLRRSAAKSPRFSGSFAVAVGQTAPDDPDPVAPMRGVDGTSWNNNRPAGVAFGLQIRQNSVERQRDEASNVFAQECSGSRGCNKAMQLRPEVTVVLLRALSSRDAERLAREAARPDFFVVGPAGETAGVGEATEAGEEVALAVTVQIVCGNRSDVSVIDIASRDESGVHEISEPLA
ncbi:hypothetical protein [Lysobacter sp. Root690]|uniref:hypothetical protein n=1 Tax=Lysobacter sp. Root690 TaxID=1736588 RepID=UPI0006FC55C6|nr:hypothetical protein [Lysobacter sp. Root690]KRB08046.1 hypothetical protein ASD86_09635 [Lysobacter sp. Root690]